MKGKRTKTGLYSVILLKLWRDVGENREASVDDLIFER